MVLGVVHFLHFIGWKKKISTQVSTQWRWGANSVREAAHTCEALREHILGRSWPVVSRPTPVADSRTTPQGFRGTLLQPLRSGWPTSPRWGSGPANMGANLIDAVCSSEKIKL
jgi:hypothetical protein